MDGTNLFKSWEVLYKGQSGFVYIHSKAGAKGKGTEE